MLTCALCGLLDSTNTTPVSALQLGGFVEKYAGSGVSVHAQGAANKENRRTDGLNRYLQALQSNQGASPGQRAVGSYHLTHSAHGHPY